MKTIIVIILFLISNISFAQSLTLDYKNVGEVNYHNSITLSHQYNGVNGPPMVTIYLLNLQTNQTTCLLTEKWESDNWHYHSFDVSKYDNGSYKFIVGFGKDTSKEIEFYVWNKY